MLQIDRYLNGRHVGPVSPAEAADLLTTIHQRNVSDEEREARRVDADFVLRKDGTLELVIDARADRQA